MTQQILTLLFAAVVLPILARSQDQAERITELERKLSIAKNSVTALQKMIENLSSDLQALRQPLVAAPVVEVAEPHDSLPAHGEPVNAYREKILRPNLGQDERATELSARPELFIQSRFQALPISGGTQENAPSNFLITRMESRWAGRI